MQSCWADRLCTSFLAASQRTPFFSLVLVVLVKRVRYNNFQYLMYFMYRPVVPVSVARFSKKS
jgi:hypothetical protein